QADQFAGGAQRVDLAVGDGRGRARPLTAEQLLEEGGVGVDPQLPARGGLVADHRLLVAALLQRDGEVAGAGERRAGGAGGATPDLSRGGGGPSAGHGRGPREAPPPPRPGTAG